MTKTDIKYQDIDKIGMELFRKNNGSYIRSGLSDIMKKIFISANKTSGITNIDDEHYMKSGVIPGRIFYIYSDQLYEKDKTKIYDIVNFNNEECIWLYSTNVINMIGESPVNTIILIYSALLNLFKNYKDIYYNNFSNKEKAIIIAVMSIRLMVFLYDEYGVLDLDECKKQSVSVIKQHTDYTESSIMKFIEDTINRYDNIQYFTNREYLNSYMLLEKEV